jgi:vacuolar-type H+-ATPase subunit E/Vma4
MNGTLPAALEPVRDALRAAARREADRARTQAESAAGLTLAEAEETAAQIRREAHARAIADCAEEVATERSRAGRQARTLVLRARLDEYQTLRAAAREAVGVLREDPDYPRIRQGLIGVVRSVLGVAADVREGDCGGIVGEVPGRRADYSLAAFAERAVDAVLADLDQSGGPDGLNGVRRAGS